jgi:hypothetical protein
MSVLAQAPAPLNDQLLVRIADLERKLAGLEKPSIVAGTPVPGSSARPVAAVKSDIPTVKSLEPSVELPQDSRSDFSPLNRDVWRGSVSCTNAQFSVQFEIAEVSNGVASGRFTWSGSSKGSTSATLSEDPSGSEGNQLLLVTDGSSAYDYRLNFDGERLNGKSTRQNCGIVLR